MNVSLAGRNLDCHRHDAHDIESPGLKGEFPNSFLVSVRLLMTIY
jgi:hypothetical protein